MSKAFKIGDVVSFKSDVEQVGRVHQIKKGHMGQRVLVLKATRDSGFRGDYIGGNEFTEQSASDCWVE